jgi:2-methylisocitrate lyase-like PEP mutase family enzyme
MTIQTEKLQSLLKSDTCHTLACCWDGLSARMIEQAGFPATFMSGFAVSAARIAQPDLGLMSYGEILDQGQNICSAVDIPVIGDGDTGYGNALNVKRTVAGYARAGFACIMIEDQVAPKRCGHTKGKLVVDRQEAADRIRAAVDARAELRERGGDILIMSRTDARALHGLGEAINRVNDARELGADILFVEAPETVQEMRQVIADAPGPHMANLVQGGKTPILSPAELNDVGYRIAISPLALMASAMQAIKDCLADISAGTNPEHRMMPFDELRRTVGFDDYYEAEQRYATSQRSEAAE